MEKTITPEAYVTCKNLIKKAFNHKFDKQIEELDGALEFSDSFHFRHTDSGAQEEFASVCASAFDVLREAERIAEYRLARKNRPYWAPHIAN